MRVLEEKPGGSMIKASRRFVSRAERLSRDRMKYRRAAKAPRRQSPGMHPRGERKREMDVRYS